MNEIDSSGSIGGSIVATNCREGRRVDYGTKPTEKWWMVGTIDDLMKNLNSYSQSAHVPFDPLVVPDLLQECSILDIKVSSMASRAGVIFDLRTALSLGDGNTGLLIVGEIRAVEWTSEGSRRYGEYLDPGEGIDSRSNMFTVMGSVPRSSEGRFDIEIPCNSSSVLKISGGWAVFIEGNVNSIGEAQPDLVSDTQDQIDSGFQQWNSAFEPIYIASSTGSCSVL